MGDLILDPEDHLRLQYLQENESKIIGSGHWSMVVDNGDGSVTKYIKERQFVRLCGPRIWESEVTHFQLLSEAFPEGVKGLPKYYGSGFYDNDDKIFQAGFCGYIKMEKMSGENIPKATGYEDFRQHWENLIPFLHDLQERLNRASLIVHHFQKKETSIECLLQRIYALTSYKDPLHMLLVELRDVLNERLRTQSMPVLHHDPNSGNVLMDKKGEINLVDMASLSRDPPEWQYWYCIAADHMPVMPDFIVSVIKERNLDMKIAYLSGVIHQLWNIMYKHRGQYEVICWDEYPKKRASIQTCLNEIGIKYTL